MDVDEGCPGLRSCWRERVLPGCGLSRSGCGKGFGLGWAVGDADL